MLHLVTFGSLSLRGEQSAIVPLPEKALIIIAYMLIERHSELPRDLLVSFLFGSTSPSALANFRKLVERVRKCAADGLPVPIKFSSATARLDLACLSADFDVLRSEELPPLQRLSRMLELVQRQFLPDHVMNWRSSWIAQQRDRWVEIFRQTLLEAHSSAASGPQLSLVKESAQILLEIDPLDFEVSRILLEIHGGGDRSKYFAQPLTSVDASEPIRPLQLDLPRLVLLAPHEQGSSPSTVYALIEDITISLCALKTVAVVAPYTAARIRAHPDKLAQLEKHNISYILDTSISDDKLFVQMVFLPSDTVLWAERFTLRPQAFFFHRRAVARMIVDGISEHLSRSEEKLADFRAEPHVYRSYLASSNHLRKFALQDVRRARHGFRETLKLKVDFAPALAGLTRTYCWEWVLTARGDGELLMKANECASLAIYHDPFLPIAHQELGLAKLYLGEVDESLEAFARAEQLGPHLADAAAGYGDAFVHASRPVDGLARIKKAMSLNPISPDEYFWIAAGASYFLTQFEDAIAYIERMADPSSAQRLLAASHAMAGNLQQARFHRKKALELNPYFDLEKWLSVVPVKEKWQKDLYREGLSKAGF
jgi:tetratricopeptide (TPR) repeat protein/DNA-binding SARP family transcriptional activator